MIILYNYKHSANIYKKTLKQRALFYFIFLHICL